uniref:Uncharacterized protein n=1 Tax=Anguilla anguilla TaxID=7936 RepID=A0A0E9QU89_ANGAN
MVFLQCHHKMVTHAVCADTHCTLIGQTAWFYRACDDFLCNRHDLHSNCAA